MRRRWIIRVMVALMLFVGGCAAVDPTIPVCRDATRRTWRPGYRVGKAWCAGYWDYGRTPSPACPLSRR